MKTILPSMVVSRASFLERGCVLRTSRSTPAVSISCGWSGGHSRAPLRLRSRVASLLLLMLCAITASAAPSWLDQLDEALHVQSPGGFFRADLSTLIDLEGYYIDQRPPGLIFPDDQFFFNPRASFFVDARLGTHFYGFLQARVDRGFDPGAQRDGDARLDEYFLRYSPLGDARINLQAGKFATAVGNWVARHDSWNNPFITAPLPYENVLTITDQAAPPSAAGFLGRRDLPDRKAIWVPVIWGPSYASGASVFGRLSKIDYALEVKNASISSRPRVWDGTELGWDHPTVSGRIGYAPSPTWNFGASFSHGAYLLPAARASLPAGKGLGDFAQTTFGQDFQYAWRHWQVWGEVFFSRFEVPNVGDADTLAYYVETRYKITPQLFAAWRWNQQFFDRVRDAAGNQVRWDRDLWRADTALTYRFDRHWQAKVQYSYSHQQGPVQQGEQLVAAQVTLKF